MNSYVNKYIMILKIHSVRDIQTEVINTVTKIYVPSKKVISYQLEKYQLLMKNPSPWILFVTVCFPFI